jgi:hypothetical protein
MPDKLTPLAALIWRLSSQRPSSIGTLVSLIQDHQDYRDFVQLIREFLPEREPEILEPKSPAQQMARFAGFFANRYFPLPFYFRGLEAEAYADLTRDIPLMALGFSYQDYDDLVQNGNIGAMLMTYFFRQPYGEQGARVALGEACQEQVPVELLQRIPEPGFTPEDLHRLLDGTPYQALATWGDLINLSAGNDFLDTDEEMMANSVLPEWSKENGEYFTRQGAEAEEIRQRPFEMMDKFADHPQDYLREVLDFIKQRQEESNGTDTDQGTLPIAVGAT